QAVLDPRSSFHRQDQEQGKPRCSTCSSSSRALPPPLPCPDATTARENSHKGFCASAMEEGALRASRKEHDQLRGRARSGRGATAPAPLPARRTPSTTIPR